MRIFDVSPLTLRFVDWGGELADAYAEEAIPSPLEDTDWQIWGTELLQLPPFSRVPTPSMFSNWQDWAEALLQAL